MTLSEIKSLYRKDQVTGDLVKGFVQTKPYNVHLKGGSGSVYAFRIAALFQELQFPQLVICDDK